MFKWKFDRRTAKKAANPCPDCKGWGQTDETGTEFESPTSERPFRTICLGSGCPRCRGRAVSCDSAKSAQ